ncbi:halocyanin domain-containing protein [Halorhabdus amylolytica]|uniref:halocyanin domain-containing protein n=1 Tax=Halorhabdus amylolytica TaxID=2559573 RepID=UPI0020C1341D|nr:halocyanin domain-containing protein [Halorhabdus amylolytica]
MSEDAGPTVSRRGLLRGAAGTAIAAGGVAAVGTAAGQSGVDFDGWFSDVSNFDGVVDRRGQGEVTVEVGVEGNGDYWAFGPAAVRVDPGTTVVFEWTGEGSAHNVVAENDGYSSGDPVREAGTTFEHTFEETGISKYYCDPHLAVGMKGAIVVGDMGAGADAGGGSPGGISLSEGAWLLVGSLGLAVASPLLFAAFLRYRRGGGPSGPSEETREQLQRVDEVDQGPPRAEEAPVEKPETTIEHDEYDPSGTLSLVLGYLVLVVLLWVFMYFVEFLGRGPTVIG